MEESTHLWQKPRSSALRALVSSVEYVRNPPPHDREQMVATVDCSIVITLDDDGFSWYDSTTPAGGGEHRAAGACLVGPQQRPQIVSTRPQRGMLAVNFAPGGALPFFADPIHATVDGYVDLTDAWGVDGATLRERLLEAETPAAMFATLEQVLLSCAKRPLIEDRAVGLAAAALTQGAPVHRVVEHFGTTAKPFVRRFTAALGLGPKRYARVQRLQRLLHALPKDGCVDWAALAVDHGFYDQSHLIHDFAELTGVRPSDYHPRAPTDVNHLPC